MSQDLNNQIAIGRAILLLRPNTEWSIVEKDVSTMVWLTPNVSPITQQELDEAIANIDLF